MKKIDFWRKVKENCEKRANIGCSYIMCNDCPYRAGIGKKTKECAVVESSAKKEKALALAKAYIKRHEGKKKKAGPYTGEVKGKEIKGEVSKDKIIPKVDHIVDELEKVEPQPIKFTDPVPEYVYMVTDKAIKREKVVAFIQTKRLSTFETTEEIEFDYGGKHSFINCYKTLADAVRVAEKKWGVK